MVINLTDLLQKLTGYRAKLKETGSYDIEIMDSCEKAAQVIKAQRERYLNLVLNCMARSHAKICRLEECDCFAVRIAKLTKAEWQMMIKLGYKSEIQ